jgi:hypothetical protein
MDKCWFSSSHDSGHHPGDGYGWNRRVVTQAKVTVGNLDTRETHVAQTDDPEEFVFTQLPIGRYSVRIDAQVFEPFGTAGDWGRNTLHGPHFRHFDFSAFKTFPIVEKADLQIRTEIFNVTNTAGFAVPNSAYATNGFGTISSTSQFYTPREIQLALKLLF